MAGMAWNGRAPIRICDSAIEAKGRQTPANQAVKTSYQANPWKFNQPADWDETNQNVNFQMFVYRPGNYKGFGLFEINFIFSNTCLTILLEYLYGGPESCLIA